MSAVERTPEELGFTPAQIAELNECADTVAERRKAWLAARHEADPEPSDVRNEVTP